MQERIREIFPDHRLIGWNRNNIQTIDFSKLFCFRCSGTCRLIAIVDDMDPSLERTTRAVFPAARICMDTANGRNRMIVLLDHATTEMTAIAKSFFNEAGQQAPKKEAPLRRSEIEKVARFNETQVEKFKAFAMSSGKYSEKKAEALAVANVLQGGMNRAILQRGYIPPVDTYLKAYRINPEELAVRIVRDAYAKEQEKDTAAGKEELSTRSENLPETKEPDTKTQSDFDEH